MEIVIKTEGADAITAYLSTIAERTRNMRPIMKAIGERVAEQTKMRFQHGGPAPDGTPWKPPVSPNPKRLRTLTVSGHLRDSIRYQLIGNDSVAVGTNKIYAAIHQLGGRTSAHDIFPIRKKALKTPFGLFKKVRHPGSNIPARPFLGLSSENSSEIVEIINDWIMGK
jgi:phage gpG-like protein